MTAVSPSPVPPAQAPAVPPAAPAAPRRRRRLTPSTTAGRVRALATAVVVALGVSLGVLWAAVDDARDGVRVIGHDAGPQVVATGDLYFALTDMDAQLANALLIGRSTGLGLTREQALARYDQNRRAAGQALLAAGKLADEASEQRTARDLLDALGRYDNLAGRALQLDGQSAHAPGPPSQEVIALYRNATDLMKLDLLPKAYNLTLDNGTLVRHTYEDERRAVVTGTVWVVVTGVLLLALLVGLQLFLVVRFRRLLNPALAAATVIALALTASAAVMLGGQAGHLKKAKQDGFDSILALSRARAIGNSANADQTRYLLDPGRADTYEQVFLSKSQSVLYLPARSLSEYAGKVQTGVGDLRSPQMLGFLGSEAKRVAADDTMPDLDRTLPQVLGHWQRYQRDDQRIRQLVNGGRRREAIGERLGGSARDFAAYDASLVQLGGIHRRAFDQAVADGDRGTRGWEFVVPAAGLLILVLVLVGVRPRLAEYR
ncbi:hypothetical protein ACSNOI_15550 [Actinomadura kijaniata]|uniref:hypothetical protein n=1 Tax=Actinomadura kijaniata TaxID=46161 RepID=UPI003F1D29A3